MAIKPFTMLKAAIFSICFLIASFTFGQPPQFDWSFGYGQTVTRKITTDNNNNIYGVGYIIGSPDMDPGTGTSIATSIGQQDIFVSKFDPDGNLLWYRTMGGVDSEGAVDVAIDNQGNLVMTGYYNLSVDFDPSPTTYNLTSVGSYDVFVLKMDSDGNFISAASFGGTGSDESFALTLDSNNDAIITGYFSNTADFNPSVSTSNLTAAGKDIFVSKYTSNHTFLWAKSFLNSTPAFAGYYNRGYDVIVDNESNIHLTGEFTGTVDFDPGPGSFNLLSANTSPSNSPDINIFYVKLSGNGDFLSANRLLGLNPVLEKDYNDDLILGGNYYSGSVDFDFGAGLQSLPISGSVEYFLLKFSKTGTFIWVKEMGGNGNGIRPSACADPSNSILFTSNFSGTRDLDPSVSVFNLTSTGLSNAFITKLDLNGNFLWAVNYGSTSGSGITDVNSIAYDNQLGIISTGSYGTSADMDPGSGSYALNGGGNYYQKLFECQNTTSSIIAEDCSSYTAPDGAIYNASGTYTATIPNAAGCDSIITINLTINQPTSSTISPQVCGSYTAPDGTLYTSSGSFTSVIPNAAGCDSTITVNLTVHPLPTINAGPDEVICSGTSIVLSGTGGVSYTWDNGVANGVPFTPTGTVTYSVTGTSAAGCTNTDQVVVTVNTQPIVSFSATPSSGCAPLSVTFTNTTLDAVASNWSFGNGSTSSIINPSTTFINEGCYDITLTVIDANGCQSSTTFVDTICVIPNPVAGFTSSSTTITDNQSITFTNTSTGANTFSWDLGDGSPLQNTQNITHTYNLSNSDTVTIQLVVTNSSGCSDTIYQTFAVTETGVGLNIPTGFSPNNDGENDTWTITGIENYPDAIIQVFNRWGQVVFDGGQTNPSWDGYFQGKLLPTADYYFIVDLGTQEKINGVVTLKQ